MVSVKQKRLEGIIRKNISEIIQFGVKDPDVGFVTITDVQVSNDHSYAKVFVTFLGQNPRSELSKRMTIRRVPELSFVIDETEMNGRHIDEIIARIHREEKKESE